MTAQPQESGSLLHEYADRVRDLRVQLPDAAVGDTFVDEWLRADGQTPHHEVIDLANRLGRGGLLARKAATARHVRGDGLTYGSTSGRRWTLDPLPIVLGSQEWTQLERGLSQRAVLLDLVLADLYGERRLISGGLLPAAVVLGHDGFLFGAHGIRLPGAHQLVMTSTDLARDASGAWTVLSDRTQAPSGAGYAMADRRIVARTMTRLYRTTELARLRGFFDHMGDALLDAAPDVDRPHIALLSPGPDCETAFDQAFLANLLGMPLVQAEDLTMRDGQVWRRTTHKPERVDVLVRRVDAEWSDPLDLRGDSRLGVPGLAEACRRGKISVVNPLGSGVLENPALLAYLPAIAKELLGEELLLPQPRSWWLGDEESAREAFGRLDTLVIKPISRNSGELAIHGWGLDAGQLANLRSQIEAEPWRWAAQEQIAMSTTPIIGPDGLEPRRFVLRSFGVGGAEGYRFLPGGLGRVSTEAGSWIVSNERGGVAKDIWVLTGDREQADLTSRHRSPDSLLLPDLDSRISLTPRVADDLYWWGRYTERAEATARLLTVVDDLVADNHGRGDSPGRIAMTTMLDTLSASSGVAQRADESPNDFLRRMLTDASTPGTVAFTVTQVVRTSYAVRELLSNDTWLLLSRLQGALQARVDDDEPLTDTLAQMLESLIGLTGLAAENTVRDEVWSFMDLGRRVERSTALVALLRTAADSDRSPVADGQVTEATLRACDSGITFRRRLATGNGPASPVAGMLQLLLRDPINPRSLEFQIDRMLTVTAGFDNAEVAEALQALRSLTSIADPEEFAAKRTRLAAWGTQLNDQLRDFSDLLNRTYFRRQTSSRRMSSQVQIGVRQ